MELPITTFDGYQLGTFVESDKQNTDNYSSKLIPLWYGRILERMNDRTEFVIRREIFFETLRAAIAQRLNSINTIEDFSRRPMTLGEKESPYILREPERLNVTSQTQGGLPADIAGNYQFLGTASEPAIVTTINRYAYSAPPEVKLQAGVEYAVWLIRQPVGSNRSNGLVRSGAATFLLITIVSKPHLLVSSAT